MALVPSAGAAAVRWAVQLDSVWLTYPPHLCAAFEAALAPGPDPQPHSPLFQLVAATQDYYVDFVGMVQVGASLARKSTRTGSV